MGEKEVKVTLGVRVNQFTAGIKEASSTFNGFISGLQKGVGEGLALFAHLGQAVQFAQDIFGGLVNTAKSLFDTFIGGIAAEQKLSNQLTRLIGDAGKTQDFMKGLADENLRLGFVTDDMLPTINQFATALKGMTGSVDTDQLEKMVTLFRRIKAARSDLAPEEITRAILAAARGDVDQFKRVIGIGIDDITGLSSKAQKTMAALKQTGDQQLGEVTRLAGGMKPKTEDLLDLLDEVTNKLGMTDQAVEDSANDWDRQVNRLAEIWDNFKDTVGAPILSVLLDELKKLADWLAEHKDQIEELAKTLGNMTAEGLKNAFEFLEKVDWNQVATDTSKFVESLKSVDWGAIARGAEAIAKIVSGQAGEEAIANLTPEEKQRREITGRSTIAGAQAVSGALDVANGNMSLGQALSQWISSNLHNLPAGFGNSPIGQAIGYNQNVHVTVSVKNDGTLQAYVQNQANKAATNTVNQFASNIAGNRDRNQ